MLRFWLPSVSFLPQENIPSGRPERPRQSCRPLCFRDLEHCLVHMRYKVALWLVPSFTRPPTSPRGPFPLFCSLFLPVSRSLGCARLCRRPFFSQDPPSSQPSPFTSHSASEAFLSCPACSRSHRADLVAAARLHQLLAVHRALCSLHIVSFHPATTPRKLHFQRGRDQRIKG